MDAAPKAAPRSRAGLVKVLATVIAIGGALALLLAGSLSQGSEYYKHVDEVMANPDSFRDKKLQVHGNVVEGSIEQAKGTLMYRFKIQTRPDRPTQAVVAATYEGLVPDTFKGGAEVVVRGKLTPENTVAIIPDGIMAKCPSKYEADKAKPGVAQQL
jgi:cytochrome c-type biogenesis protein CcmE